ncbi:MAG: hypothetical protein IKI40_06655 [Treponema sp.]|nr:hypothetical protein [Treponema sp.]
MKRTLTKTLLVAAVAILTSLSAFAYDGSKLVDSATYAELKAKGNIQKYYYKQKNVKLGLVPDTELSKKAASFWNKAEEPSFVVENLYLMPKSKLGSGDPSKMTIEYASKVIRSVSKMKGMQYYSSDKKIETLYKEAYCIAGPKDRTKVPDDTAGSADGKIMYSMQDDNSFGKTNYRLEYHQTAQEVSAGFSNTTGLYVGPIKGINDDNLRISMVIIDCGQDFMVYMLVQAKFPALKILENSMNESFSSRLNAIYNWFIKQF